TDDKEGLICTTGSLAAGQTAPACTKTSTAVESVKNSAGYKNIGTVTGTSPLIGEIVDTNPDRYFGARPVIRITTKTNHTDNDLTQGPSIHVGSDVLWTYEVTNTANVTLNHV